MTQCGLQERAKATSVRVGHSEAVGFQEVGEESLSQILGPIGVLALVTHLGVNGIPVGLAQRGQRVTSVGTLTVSRRQDNAPLCGREAPTSISPRCLRHVLRRHGQIEVWRSTA